MKRILSILLIAATANLFFGSCEKQTDNAAPELPPLSSMKVDFSNFNVNSNTKSAVENTGTAQESQLNFGYAWLNVAYFNTIMAVTLAVPVASFATSFKHEPVFLGDATWEWSYTVDGFGGAYSARLTGTVESETVKWKMYLKRDGINAFPEFLWFEGSSNIDATGGEWLLYHSYEFQEEVLSIDWQKTGDEVGDITYTHVRALDDNREVNPFSGSFIHAGKMKGDLNAYYDVHIYSEQQQDFVDVNIEWSTETYNGRVKSNVWLDGTWQCWDTMGYDIDCTE